MHYLLPATIFMALRVTPFAAGQAAPAVSADPAAYALLKAAHDGRSAFPPDFAGVTAFVAVNDNGQELKGKLTYAQGKLDLALEGASKQQDEWAREQLGSAFSHRTAQDFAKGDGKYALSFASDDHSPLGRLISLNDKMKSTVRVRDGKLTQVNRAMGDMRFTITVLDNRIVDGGMYLPSQFVVTYFDATGAIKQVDAYSDTYARVGGAWVPASRSVITAEKGGFTARTFALTEIRPVRQTAAKR